MILLIISIIGLSETVFCAVKSGDDVKTIINAFVKGVNWSTSTKMVITPPPHDNSRLSTQWSVLCNDKLQFHIDESTGKITFAFQSFPAKSAKIVNLKVDQALSLAKSYLTSAGLRIDDLQVESNGTINYTQQTGLTRWNVVFRKAYQGILYYKLTSASVDLDPATGELLALSSNCDFVNPPTSMSVTIKQDAALQIAKTFSRKRIWQLARK
jgi:hypothetical protein